MKTTKCQTKYCRNRVFIRKNGSTNKHCSKCMMRKFKEKNPHRYFWAKLRNRAKERGHDFSLTLEQFTCFCNLYSILERRGKTANSISIDRINPDQGYHMWNIQPLTLAENSRKAWVEGCYSKNPF